MKKFLLFAFAIVFSSSLFAQANPKNPFDNVGQEHNDLLALWIKTCQTIGQDEWGGYYKEQFDENHLATLQEIMPIKKLAEGGGDSFANYLLNSKTYSKTVKSYYKKMRAAVAHNDGSDAVVKRLIGIEAEIIANKEIDKGDRQALLSGASVFRYSYHFWDNYYPICFPDHENPFGGGIDIWYKGAPIVEADATTAIAVGGSLAVGIATPPTGVAAGTVTVGSAAIASASVAVVEGAKWVWDKIWN